MSTTPPDDGTVIALGPDQLAAKNRAFVAEVEYAIKSHTHVWTVMQLHVVSGDTLTEHLAREEAPLLDGETFRAIEVGCYVCEQPFDPRLVTRKCKAVKR